MRVSILSFIATLASLAAAQGPNAINIPTGGLTGFAAGKDQKIEWSNPQGSTVTIKLRQGSSNALNEGTVIADHIENTGSYTWSIPSDIVAGQDYALEIIDDDNPNLNNYSPPLAISSPNTASASGSSASQTGSSTSSGTSSASSTSSGAATTTTDSSSTSSSASDTATAASSASPSSSSGAAIPMMEVSGSLLALAFGVAAAL